MQFVFFALVLNICAVHATTQIQWKVPMSTTEQKQTVKVNTDVVFTWSGTHNVYMFPTKADFDSCNFAKATEMGTTSPYTYKPSSAGMFYFGCQIAGHCNTQKLALTVTSTNSNFEFVNDPAQRELCREKDTKTACTADTKCGWAHFQLLCNEAGYQPDLQHCDQVPSCPGQN